MNFKNYVDHMKNPNIKPKKLHNSNSNSFGTHSITVKLFLNNYTKNAHNNHIVRRNICF